MDNETVKTIVVVNDFGYIQGGASKVAIDTANIFVKQGYNVIFFCGVSSSNSNINDKVKIICTNQPESLKDRNRIRGVLNNLYNFRAKKKLVQLLRTLDPNTTVVHYHGWTKCLSSSVFAAAYKMRFKTVLTLHDYFLVCPNGGFYDYRNNKIAELKPWQYLFRNCDSRNYAFQLFRLLRFFIQNRIVRVPYRTDIFISVSDFSKKIIERNNKSIKPQTISNPIFFTENNKTKKERENFYLYVGRLSKEKGIEDFCEAITQAKVHGIVIGDGELKEKLVNQYKNIEFKSWQPHNVVKNYMSRAKALIFPSRWYETMGLTVLEALSSGTPVIVNSNTAAAEYITKENGLLYGNLDDLADVLKPNNNFMFSSQKSSFEKQFREKYSIDSYANNLLAAYKGL